VTQSVFKLEGAAARRFDFFHLVAKGRHPGVDAGKGLAGVGIFKLIFRQQLDPSRRKDSTQQLFSLQQHQV
jgi:hypothetical protein